MKIIEENGNLYIDKIINNDGLISFNIPIETVPPEDETEEFIDPLKDIDIQSLLKEYENINLKKIYKVERNKKTSTITVTLENKVILDGDEKSQERISRAINALEPEETTYWIDASGEPQELTREDLKEALKLAGQKQTEIFVEYAQKKAELQA